MVTERLRTLIHISNYFQTLEIMEKTLSDVILIGGRFFQIFDIYLFRANFSIFHVFLGFFPQMLER